MRTSQRPDAEVQAMARHRAGALDEMVADAEANGSYDGDPAVVREALRRAREGRGRDRA